MTYATVTLSSVGTSSPINLNWLGGLKPTLAVVTSSGTGSSADFIVQGTLSDAQRVASSLAIWFGLSSAVSAGNFPAFHYASSNAFPGGSSTVPECVFLPIPPAIAGLRLSSTAIAAGTTLTLQVNQGEGG